MIHQPTENSLTTSPYQSYVYAYPHKTAYRPIEPRIPLHDIWANEDTSALFLYVHIPFCEMRCGFCNLFTTVHPSKSLESLYINQLKIQAQRTMEAIGEANFVRMAIGGGTPTYLSPEELHGVFQIAQQIMGVNTQQTGLSVETSPLTATPDRLAVLRNYGVDRISIGVQSFFEEEVRGAGRSQKTADVHHALNNIRASGVPTLNIDLIYGLPHQTVHSWLESIKIALDYAPEELYLYPLYVRPLTGLDKLGTVNDDIRLACYRAGRELLLDRGYEQISMRMFRAQHAPQDNGLAYCCQEDGMIGLGCGARSYTQAYHYSMEYAVGQQGVREILREYVQRSPSSFDTIDYGFYLDADDQRRRYILKSILHGSGLSLAMYHAYFGTQALEEFPELMQCLEMGLLDRLGDHLYITPRGFELSDTFGHYFYSAKVKFLMEGFDLR